MFYSHAEKVRIAKEVLASCQAEDEMAGDFLSKCQKRGITAGHRDTEDELADIDVLGHYSLAFLPSCNVIRDLASGTSLPTTDIVFNEGGQFDVLGRQVPFYYRQYYSAKEKLEDAYREMRGINISL